MMGITDHDAKRIPNDIKTLACRHGEDSWQVMATLMQLGQLLPPMNVRHEEIPTAAQAIASNMQEDRCARN